MKRYFFLILFFLSTISNSQTINLNESYINEYLRTSQLLGNLSNDISFTLKPLDIGRNALNIDLEIINNTEYSTDLLKFFKNNGIIKILPVNYNIEFNSHHPYNRNNGSMIPNRGYQHILSAGFYAEIGPLSIQFKPEHLFSENKDFEGFGEGKNGHFPYIWAKRYRLWNNIDTPERFGNTQHNKTLLGQSSIRFNYKSISLGVSNENIWWGPSIRNSIMMSNNARGFKHITFNTRKPLKTKFGNFEWQLVSGKLENSGFTPHSGDVEGSSGLYVPKINQISEENDWRYFQGYSFTYSPKWVSGFSIGFIRWVQMYSALVKGKYSYFMNGNPSWFPVFSNIFRKNDKYVEYEMQTDQAAGIFLRWLWKEAKSEIYFEFHYNDSKQNLRDLILDTDHSRATTLGLQKVFDIENKNYIFSWEWTQLEQTGSRLLREARSWYEHGYVRHGYTNKGEVLGAGIGPGSNSHYFEVSRIEKTDKLGVALEIIDHDNDFYHEAFLSAQDHRRYWKDINFHINYSKKIRNLWISSNLIYSRSLNYQWELDDDALPYFHPGNDQNNFHASFKISYFFSNNN